MPKRNKKSLDSYVDFIMGMPEHARQVANFDAKFHKYPDTLKAWKSIMSIEEMDIIVYLAVHGKQNRICGYMVTSTGPSNSLLVHRMLVDPELRRLKIGTRLLLRFKGDIVSGVKRINYVVPEVDLDTQLFLRAVGFQAKLPLKADAFPGYAGSEAGIKFTYKIQE